MSRHASASSPHSSGARLLHATGAWDPATLPPSRAEAEQGVQLAYAAAGLQPPSVVWCPSPVALAAAWASAACDPRGRRSVGDAVIERPFASGKRHVSDLAHGASPHACRPLLCEPGRAAATATAACVLDAVGNLRPPLLGWLCGTGSASSYRLRRPVFAASGYGPDHLRQASLVAYIEEALTGSTSAALRAQRLIAENAGWVVPHERTCWLSERPDVLQTDAYGRLHAASGPALRYRDGWSAFFWKGVVVPAWVIQRPADITLDWIDAQIEAPVRHAMIDIYSAERFVAAGGADPASRDVHGVLWSRTWTHRGIEIDKWCAVELRGDQGAAFHPVPARVRSPAEALAWLRRQPGHIG